MVIVWIAHYEGGFAWQSDPGLEFNYHPFFMIVGLVFLYGDAILAFRVFRNGNKLIIKIVHACMQAGALLFASVGLKAVFDSHNLAKPTPYANMYSLHSWLGIITVVLFGLQWVIGFGAYLHPKAGMAVRRMLIPFHIFFGITILCLAVTTSLTGITEMGGFTSDYSKFIPEGYLLNFLGLTIFVFTTLVIFLVTRPEFKRPPEPVEEHQQLVEQ